MTKWVIEVLLDGEDHLTHEHLYDNLQDAVKQADEWKKEDCENGFHNTEYIATAVEELEDEEDD